MFVVIIKEIRSLKLCQGCKIIILFSTQYSLPVFIIIEKVVNWSKNGFLVLCLSALWQSVRPAQPPIQAIVGLFLLFGPPHSEARMCYLLSWIWCGVHGMSYQKKCMECALKDIHGI